MGLCGVGSIHNPPPFSPVLLITKELIKAKLITYWPSSLPLPKRWVPPLGGGSDTRRMRRGRVRKRRTAHARRVG